jgi:hypothetical protein
MYQQSPGGHAHLVVDVFLRMLDLVQEMSPDIRLFTLYNCAFVCRGWHDLTLPKLYSDLSISLNRVWFFGLGADRLDADPGLPFGLFLDSAARKGSPAISTLLQNLSERKFGDWVQQLKISSPFILWRANTDGSTTSGVAKEGILDHLPNLRRLDINHPYGCRMDLRIQKALARELGGLHLLQTLRLCGCCSDLINFPKLFNISNVPSTRETLTCTSW